MYNKAQQDFKEKEHIIDQIDEGGYSEGTCHGYLATVMRRNGKRFWAGDNISEYVTKDNKDQLIEEATVAFEGVLKALHNAPHLLGHFYGLRFESTVRPRFYPNLCGNSSTEMCRHELGDYTPSTW